MASFDPIFNPFENVPKIANNITELIGCTPCVRLGATAVKNNVVANIILKMESFEPCSSVKDRIAKSMIEEAEKRGEIVPGKTTIVEPTSGNTGIGLAMVAAAKGYKLIVTMPASVSIERRVILKGLGARCVLTPAPAGMSGAIMKANEILKECGETGWMPMQFSNNDNPAIHFATTGPELWYQTDGKLDIFVSGVGTGGTITGVSRFIRTKNPALQVIAVEPTESPVLAGGKPSGHKIQGIGAGFIPANADTSLFNEIVHVSGDEAIAMARGVAVDEGLFVGISAGAAIASAIRIGQRPENAGKNIVVIIPSHGERYLSSALFAELHAEALSQPLEPAECITVDLGSAAQPASK